MINRMIINSIIIYECITKILVRSENKIKLIKFNKSISFFLKQAWGFYVIFLKTECYEFENVH